MRKLLFVTLCLFSINVFAFADNFLTGNGIYEDCSDFQNYSESIKSPQELSKQSMLLGARMGMCYTAVMTAFDTIVVLGYTWAVDDKFAECMMNYYGLDKISPQQLLDMTITYLRDNPKKRNLSIPNIMALVMNDAFPTSVCGAPIPNNGKQK